MANEKITLPNGIVLEPDSCLDNYARSKGLKNIRCFLSTDPKGHQEYLVVEGQEPVFASQKYEDIGAHLDIMALEQQFDERGKTCPR